MLNELKKTAEDRRRPPKSAEDRRISKSSQKITAEISMERKFAEDRRRRRRLQNIAKGRREIAEYCENIAERPRKIAEDSKRSQNNERKTN